MSSPFGSRICMAIPTIVLLALATALSHPCPSEASAVTSRRRHLPELRRWHVSVVNELSGGKVLFLHCQSKDDDLGLKNLSAGSNSTWGFRENLFEKTMFWCYARDQTTSRREAAFKVFWHDVLLFYKCGWSKCIWIVKDDGVYIRDLDQTGNVDELRYTWGNPLKRLKQ